MRLRSLVVSFASFVMPFFGTEIAHAGEDEARISVEVTMPSGSQLLERRRGDAEWTVLCRASCVARALSEHVAEHVVITRNRQLPVTLYGYPVTVEMPSNATKIAGIGVVSVGGLAAVGGFIAWLSGLHLDVHVSGPVLPLGGYPQSCQAEYYGDPSGIEQCARERRHGSYDSKDDEERREIGVGLMVAGAIVSVVGAGLLAMNRSPVVRETKPTTAALRFMPSLSQTQTSARSVTRAPGTMFYLPIIGGEF